MSIEELIKISKSNNVDKITLKVSDLEMFINSQQKKIEELEEVINEDSSTLLLTVKITNNIIQRLEEENEELKAKLKENKERHKKIATDFFYHWYNSKGNNTEQGFNKWWSENKNNY